MKTSRIISFFLLILFQQFASGQESGEKHFYVNSTNEIETIYFDDVIDDIAILGRKTDSSDSPKFTAALIGIVIGELVPILVEKVGLLAYNPKNYIAEYGANYSFKLNALRNMGSIGNIVYTRTVTSNDTVARFEFDIAHNLKGNTENVEGYSAIALEKYQSNYTKVKIKNSGKKTNLVLEITLLYYDLEDKKQELNLQPYKLTGIISKGPNGKSIPIVKAKRNYQIIPPIKFIESIGIKVTEVNDRKKDWDKYLELFNNQKGNISNFLIDQLE